VASELDGRFGASVTEKAPFDFGRQFKAEISRREAELDPHSPRWRLRNPDRLSDQPPATSPTGMLAATRQMAPDPSGSLLQSGVFDNAYAQQSSGMLTWGMKGAASAAQVRC
jgi:hypothetical protein